MTGITLLLTKLFGYQMYIGLATFLGCAYLKHSSRRIKIKDCKSLINSLYSNFNPHSLQENEQSLITKGGGSDLYGEIAYETFQIIMNKLKPKYKDTFVDLGSGLGKTVIQAYLDCNIKKCIGIELSPTRYAEAVKAKNKLEHGGYKKYRQKIEFWNKNLFDANISDATIILLNCLIDTSEEFRKKVMKKLSQIKHPAHLIVVTGVSGKSGEVFSHLTHKRLRAIEVLSLPTSWSPEGSPIILYELLPPETLLQKIHSLLG